MDRLPAELLSEIACLLHPNDACALRLVCRTFLPWATPQAFSVFTVRNTRKQHAANAFLASDYTRYVRHVVYRSDSGALHRDQQNRTPPPDLERRHSVFSSSFPPVQPWKDEDSINYDHYPHGFPHPAVCECGHSDHVVAVLNQLARLPRLRKFTLVFHPQCMGPETLDFCGPCKCAGFQTTPEREGILKDVFTALQHAHALTSLEVINLQNINNEAILDSAYFKTVLGRLQELRVCFIVEQNHHADAEFEYNQHELWNFRDDFTWGWLFPCRNNLRSLSLHCNEYWGFVPQVDLRYLHFPKLERLDFGSWGIWEEWQLAWIAGHGKTLRELYLFNCPIIHACRGFQILTDPDDETDYPDLVRDRKVTHFKVRWAEGFAQLRKRLGNLTQFRMGMPERNEAVDGTVKGRQRFAICGAELEGKGAGYWKMGKGFTSELEEFLEVHHERGGGAGAAPLEMYAAVDAKMVARRCCRRQSPDSVEDTRVGWKMLHVRKKDRAELDRFLETVKERRERGLGEGR